MATCRVATAVSTTRTEVYGSVVPSGGLLATAHYAQGYPLIHGRTEFYGMDE